MSILLRLRVSTYFSNRKSSVPQISHWGIVPEIQGCFCLCWSSLTVSAMDHWARNSSPLTRSWTAKFQALVNCPHAIPALQVIPAPDANFSLLSHCKHLPVCWSQDCSCDQKPFYPFIRLNVFQQSTGQCFKILPVRALHGVGLSNYYTNIIQEFNTVIWETHKLQRCPRQKLLLYSHSPEHRTNTSPWSFCLVLISHVLFPS